MTATNRYRDGLLAAARLVPQNWDDPLWHGPRAILDIDKTTVEVTSAVACALNAVRERIVAAAREAGKAKRESAKGAR